MTKKLKQPLMDLPPIDIVQQKMLVSKMIDQILCIHIPKKCDKTSGTLTIHRLKERPAVTNSTAFYIDSFPSFKQE